MSSHVARDLERKAFLIERFSCTFEIVLLACFGDNVGSLCKQTVDATLMNVNLSVRTDEKIELRLKLFWSHGQAYMYKMCKVHLIK